MSRLPDTDDRAVRLHLIDIAAVDPDVLRSRNRSRDHSRSHHRRSRDYRRRGNHSRSHHRRSRNHRRGRRHHGRGRNRAADDSTDHPAREARPEITSAATPPATVTMPMRMARTARMNGTTPSAASASPRARKGKPRNHYCAERNDHFHLVHVLFLSPPFWAAYWSRNPFFIFLTKIFQVTSGTRSRPRAGSTPCCPQAPSLRTSGTSACGPPRSTRRSSWPPPPGASSGACSPRQS